MKKGDIMQLLAEIFEKDVFSNPHKKADCYALRRVANAVLLNEKNQIALCYASKSGFYILPGGKIEDGENFETALKREIMEEVGCDIEIVGEVGSTIAYEDKIKNINISFTFLASVKGSIGLRDLTEGEKKAGFELRWYEIDEAITSLENAKTDDYIGSFLLVREQIILRKAKELVGEEKSDGSR
jgi:8-oxo-dGTP pyrophosphatase MutT (NUDIX family)